MKHTRLILLLCILPGFNVFAQKQSPFRQFYFNPYQFNPGYLGMSGFTEINASYRQQWVGIEDAPTSQALTFQLPMKSRVGLGMLINSQEAVLLRTTRALVSFNYAIPLGIEHSLRFGLSGGVVLHNLSLRNGEYDPNDPTITNAAPSNYGSDGNFGIVYGYRGLKVGFAFPQLFRNRSFSQTTFDELRVGPLDNRMYSASYHFNLSHNIAFEPYVLYREFEDKTNNWEGAGILYLKDAVWLGGSYHSTNGIGLLAGLTIKERFRVGYSYELPPQGSNFINTTSHELQVGIRLGKNKRPVIATRENVEETKPVDSATEEDEPTSEEKEANEQLEEDKEESHAVEPALETEELAENSATEQRVAVEMDGDAMRAEKEKIAPAPNNLSQPTNQEPFVEAPDARTVAPGTVPTPQKTNVVENTNQHGDAGKPKVDFSLHAGHYVVIGVFRLLDNAMTYALEIQNKGLGTPQVALNPKNGYYCVYTFSSYDLDEARKERTRYRLKRPFAEAWILTIE